ncbi:ANK3 [Symbiodinium natans]|uniref:ANK3 protein n=1 Tax=Symbiodinium natans TaxID=878477 RepID=A0A812M802_9DINO|nr:ANK3 [Symbiodinium natans]
MSIVSGCETYQKQGTCGLAFHLFVLALAAGLTDGTVVGGPRVPVEAAMSQAVFQAQEAAHAAGQAAEAAAKSAGEAEQMAKSAPPPAAKVAGQEDAPMPLTAPAAVPSAEDLKKALQAAYEAGKAAAKAQAEAEGFSQTYDLAQAKIPEPDRTAQAQAIKAASKPYVEAENQVEATVESYNSLAVTLANEVVMYVDKAKKLADMAVKEQASGSPVLASQHLLEAHKLMHQAKEKKARALRIRSLAEKINSEALPSYRQATQMAEQSAAFSALQISQQSSHLRRSGA